MFVCHSLLLQILNLLLLLFGELEACEADNSAPSSVEDKNTLSFALVLSTHLQGVVLSHRGKFSFIYFQ